MQKQIMWFIFFLTLPAITPSFAQSFFGNTNSNPPPSTQLQTAPGKPISPSEFQNRVRAMSQQNRDALNKELNDELAKQPPLASSMPPPSAMTQAETQTTTTTATSAPQTAPAATPAPVAPPAQRLAPPRASSDDGSGLGLPETTGTTSVTQKPSNQPQTYSGFVGPNNQPNTNNSSAKTGGWSIKY